MTDSVLPFVSVVVPVYNSPDDVRNCIEALLKQNYPDERYEVLVVDNNSIDSTPSVVEEYPVKLLHEREIQGSYAARNTGIENASGDIVAMLDADCTPEPDWLRAGVGAIVDRGADLVGGNVTFAFSDSPSAAEVFDAVTNMQIERNVESRSVAKTANLFVRADVFDSVGPFPSDLKSGGDVQWTGTATDAGFELVYEPRAEVSHPARDLGALLRKQYRVGKGQVQVWLREGKSKSSATKSIVRGFLPRYPSTVKEMLRGKTGERPDYSLSSVWIVSWLCLVATNFGRSVSLLYAVVKGE